MPLAKLLRLDVVRYDCLLRLESLATDYQKLLDIMENRGVRTEEFERVPVLNTLRSESSTNLMMKQSLQSKIAQLYEEYFKLLGYDHSLVCTYMIFLLAALANVALHPSTGTLWGNCVSSIGTIG
jgi:hypothetical protein